MHAHFGQVSTSLDWHVRLRMVGRKFCHITPCHESLAINAPNTPQLLYNTIVGVQANFRVSYPIRVISRVKCLDDIRKGVLNSHLGSNPNPCYIQNRVITNSVIKRFRCKMCLPIKRTFNDFFALTKKIKVGQSGCMLKSVMLPLASIGT